MDERVVSVPSASKLLIDPTTQILHTYESGQVLIRTAAPVDPSESPVLRGVQLATSSIQAAQEDARDRATGETSQDPLSVADTNPILAYVELIGPIDARWLIELRDSGVELLHYQPYNSYLCRGTLPAFNEIRKKYFVLDVVQLTAPMKPKHETLSTTPAEVSILVHGTRDEAPAILKELNNFSGVEIDTDQNIEHVGTNLHIRAKIDISGQQALLDHSLVRAIDPYYKPQAEDEVAGLIVAGQYSANGQPMGSYLHWLEDYGLDGKGVTIGIVDQGIDIGHEAFKGRIIDLCNGRKSWHGTFVAGHAAGNYLREKDANQFIYGLGIAYAADLLSQNNQRDAAFLCRQTVIEKGSTGGPGCIQNNSWGMGLRNPMDYSSLEMKYDQLVRNADPQGQVTKPLTICFSSGNNGQKGLTRPKSAKNIIVTGNSQNYRPLIGKDQSSNINALYDGPQASSWGNCADGRIRPHVVAPGEWTSAANYGAHEGDQEYISPQLTWGGGSSAASPKTAGACALLVQWWRAHTMGQDPSPAMIRALIVNGAEPMLTGGPVPNMRQGWGRLNLENILTEDVPHTYVDQTIPFSAPGEEKVWNIRVGNPQKPLKITLAWTDPGGPSGSGTEQVPAIINMLGLTAEEGTTYYQGGWRQDHFQNGWSVPTDTSTPSTVDNLQNIYLPAEVVTSVIKVTVKALNITTNCLTGKAADAPLQDFALVITNGSPDTRSTPTDVFIAVDANTLQAGKPGLGENYWQNGPGNSDTYELGIDQEQMASPIAELVLEPTDSLQEDEWWQQGEDSIQTITRMEPGVQTAFLQHEDATIATAIKIGHDLLTANGKNRLIPGAFPSIAVQAGNTVGSPQMIWGNTSGLTEVLATLINSWNNASTVKSADLLVRSKSAVLIVGSGTHVSRTDIAAMRQLTFMGTLYLLSDDSALLSFLAQRIHRRTGLQFRQAIDAAELPLLIQDTLAEAGGGQRVSVERTLAKSDTGMVSVSSFEVVEADTHLTILIHSAHLTMIQEITLQYPDLSTITMDDQPTKSLRFLRQPDRIQIDIDVPQNMYNWIGHWELQLWQELAANEPVAEVHVWTQGGLVLTLQQEDFPVEVALHKQTALLALKGDPGVALSECAILPARIASSQPVPIEKESEIIITARLSRLEREKMTSIGSSDEAFATDIDRTRSASLSDLVPFFCAHQGATVLDIPIQSRGFDAQSNSFARITRANLIKLEYRSVWRGRLIKQTEKLLLISACIRKITYDEQRQRVVSLHLYKGERQRDILVSSSVLGRFLATRAASGLLEGELLFGIKGNTLVKVIWYWTKI